jgi:glucose-6-phosphate-specific signal transduction histidine kinase
MPRGLGTVNWPRHIGVAVAYALAYSLLRHLSFSHWLISSGFRFAALLLVPYRYWPALLIGESAALSENAIACADEYGWLWGATYMVPPMLFAMPVARWCREHRRLFPTRTTTSINVFLLCTFVTAVIWTAVNMATFSLMRGPRVDAFHYQAQVVAGWYFIGSYMGILTVVPLVLLVREELFGTSKQRLSARFSESPLVLEVVCLLLPSLALLVWLASGVASDASQEARIAMFLPVAWLALRHGWRGAAVGGSAASIAVVLTMPSAHDADTLHALTFIAFTVTTMLMLGGRITFLHQRDERERFDARLAFAVAQRNAYLGELQLRQTSFALEQVSGAIQASYTQLLGRLRSLLPGTDERTYYRQAAVTQHQIYRLADSLYPLAWRERGLPAALREGSMPRALDEAGIIYWCNIGGKQLNELSTNLHLALYRLACEAVALACSKRNISQIQLRLRTGSFGGRRWAVLCVDSLVDYERLGRVRWDDLVPSLGGSGLGLGAIKDRAAIFEGKVKAKSLPQVTRTSIILFDPDMI